MHHPTDRMSHSTAFVILVVDHWLEREIAQWVHHEGSIILLKHLNFYTVSKKPLDFILIIIHKVKFEFIVK